MLAKLTSKNQITIPKKIMDKLPDVQHFDVDLQEGMVVMKPLLLYDIDLDQIRSKIKKLGIEKDTIAEAVEWARKR
jgi:bifunctional DNA-binding transcriptional regulator/antitoxin component of YhaV-PrlF toxin-antitoxin module